MSAEISRTLAKAIAYKACGKHKEAKEWATKLLEMLTAAGLFKGEA